MSKEDWSVVGVDGAAGGWAVVVGDARGVFQSAWYATIWEVWEKVGREATLVLVDMPIGLGVGRACDREAKRVLGKAHSRVFLTPSRAVLREGTYHDAAEVSRRVDGRGLSKQTWMIAPKIREVDAFMRGLREEERERVREAHPEVCLWGWLGAAVAENKKTDAGFEVRLRVLQERLRGEEVSVSKGMVEEWLLRLRGVQLGVQLGVQRRVMRDDVVDAVILAQVARECVLRGRVRTLPVGLGRDGERDEEGLRMELVVGV